MATTKMTNVQALTLAVELAKNSDNAELTEKLEKMLATASKPRAKSNVKKETSAHKENKVFACEAARLAIDNELESITNRWVVDNVTGILSTQKATSVMKVAVEELGLFVKSRDKKNTLVFTLADDIKTIDDVDNVEEAFTTK